MTALIYNKLRPHKTNYFKTKQFIITPQHKINCFLFEFSCCEQKVLDSQIKDSIEI